MDDRRARQLLDEERARLDRLEVHLRNEREDSIAAQEAEADWWDDSAELTGELLDAEALEQLLRIRREALAAAEQRLSEGTYGRSVRGGAVIPDERLEADPLASVTAEEAAAEERPRLG